MKTNPSYQPADSYLRVAAACPEVRLADVPGNVRNIRTLYLEAARTGVALLTFPELCITGYSLGDLVHQTGLLEQAKQGLQTLATLTAGKPTAMVVGLPLQVGGRLYNCAALLAQGTVRGVVPKTYRPTYNEFYEQRWYDAWNHTNTTVQLGGHEVPFGTQLLFEVGGVLAGIEICEDLWVLQPPSLELARQGACVIVNPSASPEQIGRAGFRRQLVGVHSAKIFGAYVYAGCDSSESTAEVVMGGHQLIASNGRIVAEHPPFAAAGLTMADIDTDHLLSDRRKQHADSVPPATVVKTGVRRTQTGLLGTIDRYPFLPDEPAAERDARLETALHIQAHGLATRLRASQHQRLVLGLSGGLDSTLAALVACRTARLLGVRPRDMVHALIMPGPASSDTTQQNARALAKALGISHKVVPISSLVQSELAALGHDGITQDVTYENVQARARTSLLFNYANQHRAIVLGTGDLSEIALGWCTYNGDQQSHYNVNASVPKTLVRELVAHMARQPEHQAAHKILQAVLDTVVSPELTRRQGEAISQNTEDLIGPYELHDFFLYHLVRWGDAPAKIYYLARQAFAGTYTPGQIQHWLDVFITRFARSQFKRENMPNGPKVGSVSLSPRGDWRMPPDLHDAALWR